MFNEIYNDFEKIYWQIFISKYEKIMITIQKKKTFEWNSVTVRFNGVNLPSVEFVYCYFDFRHGKYAVLLVLIPRNCPNYTRMALHHGFEYLDWGTQLKAMELYQLLAHLHYAIRTMESLIEDRFYWCEHQRFEQFLKMSKANTIKHLNILIDWCQLKLTYAIAVNNIVFAVCSFFAQIH